MYSFRRGQRSSYRRRGEGSSDSEADDDDEEDEEDKVLNHNYDSLTSIRSIYLFE